jgi:hypothetical protein
VPDAKELSPGVTPDAPASGDRRPDRPETVFPELVPFLRDPVSAEIPEHDALRDCRLVRLTAAATIWPPPGTLP